MTEENYLLADADGHETESVDEDPREKDPDAYSLKNSSRPFAKQRDSRRERQRQWRRLGF